MRRATPSLLAGALLLSSLAAFTPQTAQATTPPGVEFDGRHTWTVSPAGRSPDDATTLQWVVDAATPGDTVKLSAGVFDFGDFDNVIVPKDLTIEGAWDNRDKVPLTTIKGGMTPLVPGRKTPMPGPGVIDVNGHPVAHITQDLWGKLHYPFLYPPYFDQATLQPTGVHYNVFDDWVPVNFNLRQVAFDTPFGSAIFSSGMNGGVVERCRFTGAWPNQIDIEAIWPIGAAISYFGMGSRPNTTAIYGVLSDPALYTGTDLLRGDIVIEDNVFEGAFKEIVAGAADEDGHVIAVPFDGNPEPPEGDYASYVLQDAATDGKAFNFDAAASPPKYWVRKGYTVGWLGWVGQAWARTGMGFGAYSIYSEATIDFRQNMTVGVPNAVFFVLNGASGAPFTANIERNTMDTSLVSPLGFGTQAVVIFEYTSINAVTGEPIVPSPGTNASVKGNQIKSTYTTDPPPWFAMFAIDLEVYGTADVTQNTIDIASGSGIGFWAPTQHGVAKNNRISGTGDFAFVALPGSHGNEFLNNRVDGFTPAGNGAFDFGLGNPAVPPASGVLFSDGNFVKGVGKLNPSNLVYNCGQNNTILRMAVGPCPSDMAYATRTAAAPTARPTRSVTLGK